MLFSFSMSLLEKMDLPTQQSRGAAPEEARSHHHVPWGAAPSFAYTSP